MPGFIERTRDIYRYQHFICDSRSLCELVIPMTPAPVLKSLRKAPAAPIEGNPQHRKLGGRFRNIQTHVLPAEILEKNGTRQALKKVAMMMTSCR